MTDLILKGPTNLKGTITAPSSKAETHRALIAASLSEGLSEVKNALICDDTLATIQACRMIGAEIHENKQETFRIKGTSKPLTPSDVINCRDSGSTMRFITPICALADGISVLTGGESLRKRPMAPLLDALKQLGVQCYSTRMNGFPPIVVFGGGISGGTASIRGDVSSQFISGLLFATPMAKNETRVILTTPLESKPYVRSTLEVLRKHQIQVEFEPDYRQFHVPCNQKYVSFSHEIEGDYSSSSFLLAAAAVTNSHLRVYNLRKDTVQGDRVIVDIIKEMGVPVEADDNYVEVVGVERGLKPLDVDMHDFPDLVPVCVVLACSAKGKSVIRGVKRLRLKESDRIAALSNELTKLGAQVRATEDCFEVLGGKDLCGAELESHGDHRIAMACAVAALMTKGTTAIHGIECINKSYP
ncbi:MAG: 3-phosphoshikimate 1-carboxyvinyltransferase, partial [Candidatus Bathyarchaeia archaeon]